MAERTRLADLVRRLSRHRVLTAGAVAALFLAPACAPDDGGSTRSTTTTSTRSTAPAVTGSVVEGRPLRRRGRRRGHEALLPIDDGRHGLTARAEYASVASFAELSLQLMALGAPSALVARCHRAALEEIAHASIADAMAGDAHRSFAPIPYLLGRRIGSHRRTRGAQVARLAVDSYRDGWLNERAAAGRIEARAATLMDLGERVALVQVAADERRHAELARDIVLWCHDIHPRRVGRALARV